MSVSLIARAYFYLFIFNRPKLGTAKTVLAVLLDPALAPFEAISRKSMLQKAGDLHPHQLPLGSLNFFQLHHNTCINCLLG